MRKMRGTNEWPGACVETITFEPPGRLGKDGIQVVEALAADAAMMEGNSTAAPAAGRRIRHALGLLTPWQQRLEAAGCMHGNAKQTQDLEGSSGKPEKNLMGSTDVELSGRARGEQRQIACQAPARSVAEATPRVWAPSCGRGLFLLRALKRPVYVFQCALWLPLTFYSLV